MTARQRLTLRASTLLLILASLTSAGVASAPHGAASEVTPVDLAAWVLSADGSVSGVGTPSLGSPTRADGVALAADVSNGMYWVAFADGTVEGFGAVPSVIDLSGLELVAPVVGAETANGSLWLVTADGGVFDLTGDHFFGSIGGFVLDEPVVAMSATPSGNGYWLAASDGGVFTFGDAGFFGSVPGLGLEEIDGSVVDIVPTPSGEGYWLVASDGGVFAFGDAPFIGSFAQLEVGIGDSWLGGFTGTGGGLVMYLESGNLGGLGADFATTPIGSIRDMDGVFSPST